MEFQFLSKASDKRGPVLCDRCSSIVSSEITKCTDLLVSVSAVLSKTLWQASYLPLQSDVDAIKTRLDELYTQREAYNDEIVRVRKMLGMLKTNRQGIDRCIEGCKSLSAPIRRLPVEILIHIFRQALFFDAAPSSSLSEVFLEGCTTTPLRLGKVCHLWREIIYQNPLLWTHQAYRLCDSFAVDVVSIYQKESFPHSMDVLVYSKDIYLDHYNWEASDEDEEYHRLRMRRAGKLRRLMKQLDCGRCRRLSWGWQDCDDSTRSDILWSDLEVLEIHSTAMDLSDGSPFAHAPRLRTLRLITTDQSYDVDQLAKLCPWEEIQDLWINDDEEPGHAVNCCSAGCLRRLTLQGNPGPPSRNALAEMNSGIVAHLEELRLVNGWVVDLLLHEESVLGSMGRLTSLELCCLTTASSRCIPEYLLVVPPCPSVRNLIIRDLLIHSDALIPLICASENVRSLVIIEPLSLHACRDDDEDDELGTNEWTETVLENGIITPDVLEVVRRCRLEHLELVLAEDSPLLGRQGDVLDTIEHLHTISLQSAVVGIRGGVELQEGTLKRMERLRKTGLRIWSA